MYLGNQIIYNDKKYEMAGVFNWDFVMSKRPVGHGYSILEVKKENPFWGVGAKIKGHEFHYSKPVPGRGNNTGTFVCQVNRGHGFGEGREGLTFKNVFGTYTHIHALTHRTWGKRLVLAGHRFRQTGQEIG